MWQRLGNPALGKKAQTEQLPLKNHFMHPSRFSCIGVSAYRRVPALKPFSVLRCIGVWVRACGETCFNVSVHRRTHGLKPVSVCRCISAHALIPVSVYRRETHLADLSNKPFEKVAIVLFGNTPGTKQVLSDGGLLPNLTERPCGCALERRH